MSQPKQTHDLVTLRQRRLATDLAFSRAMMIGALVLLLFVVIFDLLYITYVPRRNGHLILPALVFAAPLTSALFILLAVWNWRVMRRRIIQRS